MIRHSVILNCYNGEQYIVEAIRSVLCQLGDYDELVVVDDGSTDSSMAHVQSIPDARIRIFLRHQNGGIAVARNYALSLVRGKYISFIDHDDLWSEGRISDIERLIEANPGTDVVHGMVSHFYDDPALAQFYKLPETQTAVIAGSVTISKDLINRIGLFNESLTCGDFVDFMARAKLISNRWISSDQIYQFRRIHLNNYTLTHAKDSTGYLSAVRAHLLRKRAQSHE